MDCIVGMCETVAAVLYACQSSRLLAASARPGTQGRNGDDPEGWAICAVQETSSDGANFLGRGRDLTCGACCSAPAVDSGGSVRPQ